MPINPSLQIPPRDSRVFFLPATSAKSTVTGMIWKRVINYWQLCSAATHAPRMDRTRRGVGGVDGRGRRGLVKWEAGWLGRMAEKG